MGQWAASQVPWVATEPDTPSPDPPTCPQPATPHRHTAQRNPAAGHTLIVPRRHIPSLTYAKEALD